MIIVFLIFLEFLAIQEKISDLNVLFPTRLSADSNHLHHLIIAYGGCYRWESSKPFMLQIQQHISQKRKQCNNSATLKLKHVGQYPSSIIVYSHDIESGKKIKVLVRIGSLERIQILTKFKIMHVNDIQQLSIIGFDKEGNSISSLQGLKFQWTIQNSSIIEIIPIKYSSIKTTQYRANMEGMGSQTDILFIKGIKTGVIKISCKVKQSYYKNIIASTEVKVFDHFFFKPDGIIYMMPQSKIQFSLFLEQDNFYQHNNYIKINMPNQFYKVQINPQFHITKNLIVTSPNKQTSTLLSIYDIRTKNQNFVQSKIIVLKPSNIIIDFPDYPIIGQTYILTAKVYNRNQYLLGQRKIIFQSGPGFQITSNKGIHQATCTKYGPNLIKAILFQNQLPTQKKVKVITPLKRIGFGTIILPVGQQYYLQIIGGMQHYIYQLQPQYLATISAGGIIYSLKQGRGIIKVTDKLNIESSLIIDLNVIQPLKLQAIQQMKQLIEGQQGDIQYSALDKNNMYYSNCTSIKAFLRKNKFYQFDIIEQYKSILQFVNKYPNILKQKLKLRSIFFHLSQQDIIKQFNFHIQAKQISYDQLLKRLSYYQNYGICGTYSLKGLNHGFAQIKITSNNSISTDFKLKVYKPLETLHKKQRILINPGSGFLWQIKNGPSLWDSSHIPIYTLYKNNMKSEKISFPYLLKCQSHLEQTTDFQIQVENSADQILPRPVLMKHQLKIQCKYPTNLQIFLVKDTDINNGYYINKNMQAIRREYKQPLILKTNENYCFQVWAFQASGVPFYNISSLKFNWKLSNNKYAKIQIKQFSDKYGSYKQEKFRRYGSIDNMFVNLVTYFQKVQIELKVQSSKFLIIGKQYEFTLIKDNVILILKDSFKLPVKNKIYDHQNNLQKIQIRDGSGFFQVSCNDSTILQYSYDDREKTINYYPLRVGITKILVKDKKIQLEDVKQSNIRVSGPWKFTLQTNKFIIPTFEKILIKVKVIDTFGQEYQSSQFKFMNIQIYEQNNKRGYKITNTQQSELFQFQGFVKGDYQIVGRLIYNKIRLISQNYFYIQVFDPLKIYIPNYDYHDHILIANGCNSSLILQGGPQQSSQVKYHIRESNPGIIQLRYQQRRIYNVMGLKQGKTKLIIQVKQRDNLIVSTQKWLQSGQINNIRIQNSFQQRKLHLGSQIRLLVQLFYDNTMLSYSLCPFSYRWKSSNQDILFIDNYKLENDDETIGVNLTAKNIGYANVEVIVFNVMTYKNVGKTTANFKVIQPLDSNFPSYIGKIPNHNSFLLIPPNSGYHMQLDYITKLSYQNSCDIGTQLISLQNNGQLISYDKRGITSIKLQDSISSMVVNVHVIDIFSVFIQNPHRYLNMQIDSEAKIKFYIQDQFGRLFPNNLKGIEFTIKVTHESILQAHISQDKQFIHIKGKIEGQALLILSIKGSPSIYDVININIGSLLLPTSPVFIHLGGIINFQLAKGKNIHGKWSTQNPEFFQINQKTGKTISLKQGSGTVVYQDGIKYKSKIKVYVIDQIQLVKQPSGTLTNYPAYYTYQAQYKLQNLITSQFRAFDSKTMTQILMLKEESSLINNNLDFECEVEDKEWFNAIGYVQLSRRDYSLPICSIQAKIGNNQMPKLLKIKIRFKSSIQQIFILQKVFSFPFYWKFNIKKQDYVNRLTKNKNQKTISIYTNSPLQMTVDNQISQFVSKEYVLLFYQDSNIGLIKLHLKMTKKDRYFRGHIQLYNIQTQQKQKIELIIDPKATDIQQKSYNFLNMQWIDWIVIIISIFLIYMVTNNLFYKNK